MSRINSNRSSLIIAGFAWFAWFVWIAAALASPPSVHTLPAGVAPGRLDAKYGTYSTPVQPSARSYQKWVAELESKAYGLAQLAGQDPVEQSEAVYVLEHEVLRLHLDISAAPRSAMTDFEREALLFSTVRIYEDVRHHGERLYENMIRFIDVKLPGPNGQQIRSGSPRNTRPSYASNYRSDSDLSAEERARLYEQKRSEFITKGGNLDEMKPLNPELLAGMPELFRVEYVERENGQVWVTPGKAGHILLAEGGLVKSAGQMVFLKNPAGQFTMLIVTNASGSYKPDMLGVSQLAERLRKQLGLSSRSVVLTKGEPLSVQAVKVYSKGAGADPKQTEERIRELEQVGHEILSQPRHLRCAPAFS